MYRYVNLCICFQIFINVTHKLFSFCIYICRPVKLPAVQKAVSSVWGRGISRGSSSRGHGHTTRSTAQIEDKEPMIQPLASDPETISDEDEDIKEIKTEEKPKKKGEPKARRGKPFQVARGKIHKPDLKKCTINLDRKDVE